MKYKACFKLPGSVKPNYEVLEYKMDACLSCKFFMHGCAPHSLHWYACTWLALHSIRVYLYLVCVQNVWAHTNKQTWLHFQRLPFLWRSLWTLSWLLFNHSHQPLLHICPVSSIQSITDPYRDRSLCM